MLTRAILGSPVGDSCPATPFAPLTQCTEFNNGSSDEWIDCGLGSFDVGSIIPWSACAWIKRSGPPSTTEPLITCFEYAPSTGWAFHSGLGSGAGQLWARMSAGNSNVIQASINTAAPFDGDWHFVAVTYDGSNTGAGYKFFVDGAEVSTDFTVLDTGTVPTSGVGSGNHLQIGRRGSGSPALYAGRMCHPAFVSRQLSADEIACLYSLGKPADLHSVLDTADVKAWYRLGEGDTIGTGNVIQLGSGQLPGTNATAANMEAGDFTIADVPP